jgi:hypothetical protein
MPREVDLGGFILDAASAPQRVWTLTCVHDCAAIGSDRDQLVEIDAATGQVLKRFQTTDAIAVATGGHAIWVAHFFSGEINRVDPRTGQTTAAIKLRLPEPIIAHDQKFLPSAITYADGYVWVSTARGWIAQINARTAKPVTMVASPSQATSTTTDRHGTWVAEELDGIGFLAPHRDRLAIHPIRWAGQALDISTVTHGAGLTWAIGQIVTPTNGPSTTVVTMIDPRTGRIVHQQRVPGADGAAGAVFTANALYLGYLKHGHLYRLSPHRTMRVLTTPRSSATLATATPGTLWATTTGRRGRLLSISLAHFTENLPQTGRP